MTDDTRTPDDTTPISDPTAYVPFGARADKPQEPVGAENADIPAPAEAGENLPHPEGSDMGGVDGGGAPADAPSIEDSVIVAPAEDVAHKEPAFIPADPIAAAEIAEMEAELTAPTDFPEADPAPKPGAPKDSAFPKWLAGLPTKAQPLATLARWDRPVGIWLLLLPCWMGLAHTRIPTGFAWIDLLWFPLFALGAIAMRGAGCTWNDITDRDIDASVARTAERPLPSGQITLAGAYIFLAAQVAIGFIVWLCLPLDAKIVALLAIPLVVAYPFMKRLTWWPQAWLGFTFNFGVLIAAATAMHVSFSTVVLYLGLVCWTIAYDTIYAILDREDDELIGVRSTARLFGERALLGAFGFHLGAAALIGLGAMIVGAGRIGAITALAFLAHGIWQALYVAKDRDGHSLAAFKSNVWAGGIVVVGFVISALFA